MLARFLALFTPAPLSESIKLYLSANALLRVAGIGRGILLTWMMISPAEFGAYQIGLLVINVLLPVMSYGGYEAIARFVPEYEAKGSLWRFLRWALPASLALGLGTCAVLFALAGPLGKIFFGAFSAAQDAGGDTLSGMQQAHLARVVAWCVATLVLYHSVLGLLRGRRMFRAVSLMELAAGISFTVLAIMATLLGQGSGSVILGAYGIANLAVAVLFAVPALMLARRDRVAERAASSPAALGDLIRYGFWAGWAAFCWQLLLLFPAYYLNRTCGEGALASYRAMTILTQLGYMIPAAAAMAVAGAVNATWESHGRDQALTQLNLAGKAILAITLLFCLALAACKGVLAFAFSDEYHAGLTSVPLLLQFYFCAGALSLVTLRFGLIKRSSLTLRCWLVGCGICILFSLLGISGSDPTEALQATARANVAGAVAALLTAGLLLRGRNLLPDRGTVVLIGGSLLIVLPTPYILFGGFTLILLTTGSQLIFTQSEKQVLVRHALALLHTGSEVPEQVRSDNSDED